MFSIYFDYDAALTIEYMQNNDITGYWEFMIYLSKIFDYIKA